VALETPAAADTRVVLDGTDPYPWPWHGRLDPARTALVLAGCQRVHAAASPDSDRVLEALAALADELRERGVTVVHVCHTATPVAPGRRVRPLLPPSDDFGWTPILSVGPGDVVVTAWGHDGFHDGALDAELRSRGIDLVLAAGLASEVAVSCTVRSANDRGYECLTLTDAIAPLDPATGARELHSVTMSGGIFGALGTTAALLEALDRIEPSTPQERP